MFRRSAFTGIIAAADTALSMIDYRSRIIPGHGLVATEQDRREWRNMLVTIYALVKKGVASGKNLEHIKAKCPIRSGMSVRSFETSAHVLEEAHPAATSRQNLERR